MAEKITYLLTFSCYHTRVFRDPAPAIGDILWCPKCGMDVRVTSAPPEWRIRCDRCAYSRRFGTGKTNAEITGAKHANQNPGHVVSLFNGHEFADSFGRRDPIVTPASPECDPFWSFQI